MESAYDRAMGFTCRRAGAGEAVYEAHAGARWHNPTGRLHGGFLAGLADAAMGAAFLSGADAVDLHDHEGSARSAAPPRATGAQPADAAAGRRPADVAGGRAGADGPGALPRGETGPAGGGSAAVGTNTDLDLRFLRPVTEGLLVATARFVRRGRQVSLLACEIRDGGGRLVATAQSQFLRR